MPLPFYGAICIRCRRERTEAVAIEGRGSVELVGLISLGALIGSGLWLYFII
jgi:hypothetical protein